MGTFNFEESSTALMSFLAASPSMFHAVAEVTKRLRAAGFVELPEESRWEIQPGGSYFTTRNGSSVAAFTVPKDGFDTCRIAASHSDSPSFKIKENPEMEVEGQYVKLNVERYGGMLMAPWFDRPLSVAGRVVVKRGDSYEQILVNVDRDLLLIPNLAIHMNRSVNDKGYAYNAQKDMLPLYGLSDAKGSFLKTVAEAAGVEASEILSHDLFLYNRTAPCIWGAQNEFVSAPRLDDLQCAYGTLMGFLRAPREKYLSVYCMFDNEEVGSLTRQGADSTFLYDVLHRCLRGLGKDEETYQQMLAKGFLISADNAHAIHPNHTSEADPVNRPYLNGGIVLKFNASQKYCTDGISAAMFKDVCRQAEVPVQIFTNRSDMAGGSTLGNISNAHVSIRAADIGLAQLAMHSPYETAGVKDTAYLIAAAETFFA